MPPSGLYTQVTEELVTEIRAAAARCGGMSLLAFEMGVNSRRIRAVICQRIVSQDWLDRFCTHAPTYLTINEFEWKSWPDLMNEIEEGWTHKRGKLSAKSKARNKRAATNRGEAA